MEGEGLDLAAVHNLFQEIGVQDYILITTMVAKDKIYLTQGMIIFQQVAAYLP